MRRLLLILVIAMIPTIASDIPPPGGFGTEMDRLMLTIYPDWWSKSQTVQKTIIYMFETCGNKHAWFPDKYPSKRIGAAPISPK